MKVFDLHCNNGHSFEGWFASHADWQNQLERGLLRCPVCDSVHIQRRPSAARLPRKSNSAKTQEGVQAQHKKPIKTNTSPPSQEAPNSALQASHAQWLQAARELVRNSEDVGDRFAQEARLMHQGEVPARAIRGRSTPEQTMQLLEEGIPVLPLPEASTQPLH